jgi:hypothetical protein
MNPPIVLSQLPAIVVTRKINQEAVMEKFGNWFDTVHAVVTQNNFPSGSSLFIRDVNINHQRALQYGLAMNKPFIVFEEDACKTDWFLDTVPNQWNGILKLDLNDRKPKITPETWAVEEWPGLFRCYSQWSCGAYLVKDLEGARLLLQALRESPDSAADYVFIKMMKKVPFYVIEDPYFYHGPGNNPKASRTKVRFKHVEKLWGGVKRLQYEPLPEKMMEEPEPEEEQPNKGFHSLLPQEPKYKQIELF